MTYAFLMVFTRVSHQPCDYGKRSIIFHMPDPHIGDHSPSTLGQVKGLPVRQGQDGMVGRAGASDCRGSGRSWCIGASRGRPWVAGGQGRGPAHGIMGRVVQGSGGHIQGWGTDDLSLDDAAVGATRLDLLGTASIDNNTVIIVVVIIITDHGDWPWLLALLFHLVHALSRGFVYVVCGMDGQVVRHLAEALEMGPGEKAHTYFSTSRSHTLPLEGYWPLSSSGHLAEAFEAAVGVRLDGRQSEAERSASVGLIGSRDLDLLQGEAGSLGAIRQPVGLRRSWLLTPWLPLNWMNASDDLCKYEQKEEMSEDHYRKWKRTCDLHLVTLVTLQ